MIHINPAPEQVIETKRNNWTDGPCSMANGHRRRKIEITNEAVTAPAIIPEPEEGLQSWLIRKIAAQQERT